MTNENVHENGQLPWNIYKDSRVILTPSNLLQGMTDNDVISAADLRDFSDSRTEALICGFSGGILNTVKLKHKNLPTKGILIKVGEFTSKGIMHLEGRRYIMSYDNESKFTVIRTTSILPKYFAFLNPKES